MVMRRISLVHLGQKYGGFDMARSPSLIRINLPAAGLCLKRGGTVMNFERVDPCALRSKLPSSELPFSHIHSRTTAEIRKNNSDNPSATEWPVPTSADVVETSDPQPSQFSTHAIRRAAAVERS